MANYANATGVTIVRALPIDQVILIKCIRKFDFSFICAHASDKDSYF